MPNPWTVFSPEENIADLSRRLENAHDQVLGHREPFHGVRRVVMDSWTRSLQLKLDPATANPDVPFDADDLREYRSGHPLSAVVPVVQRLLVRHAADAGLIVAVGDASGRLLWIDGDRALKRRAENMLFVEGAGWSETSVGTSAPGTALALDHGIQIQRAEHFTRMVHPWSCTAVPVHDPRGAVLGVIDITGGDEAVAPHTLPLIEAAVAAAEAELHIRSLTTERNRARSRPPTRSTRPSTPASMHVLGRSHAVIDTGTRTVELSPRHSEIMMLLAWHPSGLTATALSALLTEVPLPAVTLRSEMFRLRRALETTAPTLAPESKPYRLRAPLEVDAQRVAAFLDRGAHRVALAAYAGAALPQSEAPGVRAIRGDLSARVRDAMLTDAAIDTLLEYARSDDAAYDLEVWRACLRMLPPKSPKRVGVVARIEHIENDTP